MFKFVHAGIKLLSKGVQGAISLAKKSARWGIARWHIISPAVAVTLLYYSYRYIPNSDIDNVAVQYPYLRPFVEIIKAGNQFFNTLSQLLPIRNVKSSELLQGFNPDNINPEINPAEIACGKSMLALKQDANTVYISKHGTSAQPFQSVAVWDEHGTKHCNMMPLEFLLQLKLAIYFLVFEPGFASALRGEIYSKVTVALATELCHAYQQCIETNFYAAIQELLKHESGVLTLESSACQSVTDAKEFYGCAFKAGQDRHVAVVKKMRLFMDPDEPRKSISVSQNLMFTFPHFAKQNVTENASQATTKATPVSPGRSM